MCADIYSISRLLGFTLFIPPWSLFWSLFRLRASLHPLEIAGEIVVDRMYYPPMDFNGFQWFNKLFTSQSWNWHTWHNWHNWHNWLPIHSIISVEYQVLSKTIVHSPRFIELLGLDRFQTGCFKLVASNWLLPYTHSHNHPSFLVRNKQVHTRKIILIYHTVVGYNPIWQQCQLKDSVLSILVNHVLRMLLRCCHNTPRVDWNLGISRYIDLFFKGCLSQMLMMNRK